MCIGIFVVVIRIYAHKSKCTVVYLCIYLLNVTNKDNKIKFNIILLI